LRPPFFLRRIHSPPPFLRSPGEEIPLWRACSFPLDPCLSSSTNRACPAFNPPTLVCPLRFFPPLPGLGTTPRKFSNAKAFFSQAQSARQLVLIAFVSLPKTIPGSQAAFLPNRELFYDLFPKGGHSNPIFFAGLFSPPPLDGSFFLNLSCRKE